MLSPQLPSIVLQTLGCDLPLSVAQGPRLLETAYLGFSQKTQEASFVACGHLLAPFLW